MGNPPIGAVGVNLIALKFGAFFRRCVNDDGALRIYFHSHTKSRLDAMTEYLGQHFDDIIIRVVIIVQENDVIARNAHDALGRIGEINGGDVVLKIREYWIWHDIYSLSLDSLKNEVRNIAQTIIKGNFFESFGL